MRASHGRSEHLKSPQRSAPLAQEGIIVCSIEEGAILHLWVFQGMWEVDFIGIQANHLSDFVGAQP